MKKIKIVTPAFDIKVVDTTGYGDTFDAGMIVGLVKDNSLETSLKVYNYNFWSSYYRYDSDAGIVDFESYY